MASNYVWCTWKSANIDADAAQRLLPQVRAAAAAGNKPVTPELLESIYHRTLCTRQ
ncbi:hypothetical protein [Desulfobacter hydrogenophilus]|uniref:hypothetical protein n=1 Tax=Desulfobacter hydrogenophilus TaxID=2291 RepID=UPI0013D6D805|nr:hypothetical protein [Desulfobacter hydrogenophilus]NDY74340.1 hypothetical protein [Desulfobacter hydrogenophilus]